MNARSLFTPLESEIFDLFTAIFPLDEKDEIENDDEYSVKYMLLFEKIHQLPILQQVIIENKATPKDLLKIFAQTLFFKDSFPYDLPVNRIIAGILDPIFLDKLLKIDRKEFEVKTEEIFKLVNEKHDNLISPELTIIN